MCVSVNVHVCECECVVCVCGMCVGCGVYVVCVSVWCLCGVCESQGGVEKGLQVSRGHAELTGA